MNTIKFRNFNDKPEIMPDSTHQLMAAGAAE